jgi:hypothetical protein
MNPNPQEAMVDVPSRGPGGERMIRGISMQQIAEAASANPAYADMTINQIAQELSAGQEIKQGMDISPGKGSDLSQVSDQELEAQMHSLKAEMAMRKPQRQSEARADAPSYNR